MSGQIGLAFCMIRHEGVPHSNVATRCDKFVEFEVTRIRAFAGHIIGSVGNPLGAGSREGSSWSAAEGFSFLDGRIQPNWEGIQPHDGKGPQENTSWIQEHHQEVAVYPSNRAKQFG